MLDRDRLAAVLLAMLRVEDRPAALEVLAAAVRPPMGRDEHLICYQKALL